MGIKEIIPLLAAIIGLTPVILNWLNERSAEQAKRRTIDRAKQQIEFLEAWLKAQREVTSDERFAEVKNEVSERLDALMQKSIEIEQTEPDKTTNQESHFFLQKIFLLYMPRTPSGWIFHTLFYITMAFTFLLGIGFSVSPDDPKSELSWKNFQEDLGMNIFILLFLLGIAFILQRIARRTEKRSIKKGEVSQE